jgi:serine/threonine protein phosphatase PrpC
VSILSHSGLHHLPIGLACGATDVCLRDSNEDNFLIDEALGLAMVADGMGGHEAGEVASAGVLNALRDYLREHQPAWLALPDGAPDPDATWSDPAVHAIGLLYDAIDFANHSLYAQNLARGRAEGGGMGTTLTGFWNAPGEAPLVYFHVGDSRLYRQRDGQLEQLTRDQTMYQQALEGGMIEHLPPRNLLLQAVGPSPVVMPEVHAQLVQAGDVLMLCSDGLHGSVPHGEIEAALAGVSEATLPSACAQLIAMAKDYGGRDNITVLLALCR